MGAIEESQSSCLGSSRNPRSEEPTHQQPRLSCRIYLGNACTLTGCQQRSHIDSPVPIHVGVSPPLLAAKWPGGQRGLGMGLQSPSGASRMTLPWSQSSDRRTEECPVTWKGPGWSLRWRRCCSAPGEHILLVIQWDLAQRLKVAIDRLGFMLEALVGHVEVAAL